MDAWQEIDSHAGPQGQSPTPPPCPSSAADPDDGPPDAQLRLLEIACDLQELLQNTAAQRDGIVDFSAKVLERDAALAKAKTNLEQQQSTWLREREAELRLIQDEHARLAEAWNKLEQQERRIASSSGVAAPMAPVPVMQPQQASPRDFESPQHPASSGLVAEEFDMSFLNQDAPAAFQTAEPATLQFQQLKRDIGKHARRNR